MSFSGPGLSKANDSDIASYHRLEAKVLAEEREQHPDLKSCPSCIARLTKHVHHNPTKHHEINEDGDVLILRDSNEGGRSGSGTGVPSRPPRVERRSYYENEEKQRFHGAFR